MILIWQIAECKTQKEIELRQKAELVTVLNVDENEEDGCIKKRVAEKEKPW
jgi:hypothetical protein